MTDYIELPQWAPCPSCGSKFTHRIGPFDGRVHGIDAVRGMLRCQLCQLTYGETPALNELKHYDGAEQDQRWLSRS